MVGPRQHVHAENRKQMWPGGAKGPGGKKKQVSAGEAGQKIRCQNSSVMAATAAAAAHGGALGSWKSFLQSGRYRDINRSSDAPGKNRAIDPLANHLSKEYWIINLSPPVAVQPLIKPTHTHTHIYTQVMT